MKLGFILSAVTLFAHVKAKNLTCDPCPAVESSGCHCFKYIIDCYGGDASDNDQFPRFQPTTANCNVSLSISNYKFKFFLRKSQQMHLIWERKYCFGKLHIFHVPKLAIIDSLAFSGLHLMQLNLDGAGLTEFPTKALQKIQGLTKVTVKGCDSISSLKKETFRGLHQLSYLNLDNDGIRNISKNAFHFLPNLQFLSLNYNNIKFVNAETFTGLISLSTLSLIGNYITKVAPGTFATATLPNLASLSLQFSRVTSVERGAFDMLPTLTEMTIVITDVSYNETTCLQSNYLNCTAFPKLEHLNLKNAVCHDILNPLASCITSLTISYAQNLPAICLPAIYYLKNLKQFAISGSGIQAFSFDLVHLKNLESLTLNVHICDEALFTTPNLRNLTFHRLGQDHIPKPLQKMQYLSSLSFDEAPTIVCNCSSYWLYDFINCNGINASSWKCASGYDSVEQYLQYVHELGKCTGCEPDFDKWNSVTCSELCPVHDKYTENSADGGYGMTAGPCNIVRSCSNESSTGTHSHTSPISTAFVSSSTQRTASTNDNSKIYYSVIGTLLFVLMLSAGAGYYWYKRFHGIRRIKVERLALQSHDQVPDDWEICRSSLEIFEEKLGSGAFGIVIKGKLLTTPPSTMAHSSGCMIVYEEGTNNLVAVKMLLHHADSSAKSQFLQEIETMKSLGHHPHLVSIIACITMSEPICLVVDYCSDGDLLKFLRARKAKEGDPEFDSVNLKNLLSFAWQVADGMSFLSGKGYAHRDLAARNVLIHNGNIAKVSDFGLCHLTEEATATYVAKGGRVPLRWLAPECIRDYEFTTASDVWAFGILLFELVNLGSTPYEDLHLSEIEPFLAEGQRIHQPEGCPDELYQMMLQCWEKLPGDRPKFPQLRNTLMDMLEKETSETCYYTPVCP